MKPIFLIATFCLVVALVSCEPPLPKRPLFFKKWPQKSSKQVALGRTPNGKQRTFVVQIRSDQPVPLIFKGRPGQHANLQHGHVPVHHLRGAPRPLKLSAAPIYLKTLPTSQKNALRKPVKIKLGYSKPIQKPAATYGSPFKYEQPSSTYTQSLVSEIQKLPLQETHANFYSDQFTPIHTVPAPNLSLHDNHLHLEESYLPPAQQSSYKHNSQHQYQVEENTNDQTILDPFSGSQKLFAPDPDPSLSTVKLRPAAEPFNQPSNGKPLPVDVQTNYLLPAQPIVQIVGAEQTVSEIYPIQYNQPAASIPIYNPTFLVTQSNNLYTQHQQQLFRPAAASIIQAGYGTADLTQQVASNGQILQAAKDPHNNIHPILDSAPQFAALIAAPLLGEEHALETAPFNLPNVAAPSSATESGFVVSNYYGNAAQQDSSQLLQAYAEEEAQRQQLEAEQTQLELQQQQHHLQQLQQQQQEQDQLLYEQQQNHLLELQQQQQNQQLLQEQQQIQQQHQSHQLLQQQQQIQQQHQLYEPQVVQQQQQLQQHGDPSALAFAEHQRLVQQQLGADTPLRIFVPDEDSEAARLKKRSDNLVKGTVEDASNRRNDIANDDDLFQVSSSVEVSSGNHKDDDSH